MGLRLRSHGKPRTLRCQDEGLRLTCQTGMSADVGAWLIWSHGETPPPRHWMWNDKWGQSYPLGPPASSRHALAFHPVRSTGPVGRVSIVLTQNRSSHGTGSAGGPPSSAHGTGSVGGPPASARLPLPRDHSSERGRTGSAGIPPARSRGRRFGGNQSGGRDRSGRAARAPSPDAARPWWAARTPSPDAARL